MTLPAPDQQQLAAMAEQFAAENTVMVLATADDLLPWAAAVYYVYCRGDFCFFSAPDCRHIQQAQATGKAAAAIFAHGPSWQQIRGLQMAGRITPIGPGLEGVRVLADYLRKFPLLKDFFSTGAEISLDSVVSRFRVHLFRFQPAEIYYLDNRIRFGFRERVFPKKRATLKGDKHDDI